MLQSYHQISIHVPARGTTQILEDRQWSSGLFQSTYPHGVRPLKSVSCPGLRIFQSTYPHGVRLHPTISVASRIEFQSTYPHGVRRLSELFLARHRYFNPRTRTGYDPHRTPASLGKIISIHVPARGTTQPASRFFCMISFQSTYPHGVRQVADEILQVSKNFNPRTRTGYDRM